MPKQVPKISQANARVLYTAMVQQRHHWAVMINTIMGFTVTINAGVWAYLFAEFIRSGGSRPGFILIGGAISAATIVGWRLYTRYLDDNIASLYSEIFYYEKTLGVPANMGISKYLINNIRKKRISLNTKTIRALYEAKQLGSRGHHRFEQLSLAYVGLLIFIDVMAIAGCWKSISFSSLQDWINNLVYLIGLLITTTSIVILKCRKWQGQMDS
jgi:hypothetical protein